MIYGIFSLLNGVFMQLLGLNVGVTAYGYITFMIAVLCIELLIFALFYTFRSIGLYKMAKSCNLERPWKAIIPFFGIYYCYKLAPTSKFIKKKLPIYVIAIVCGAFYLLASILIDVLYGIPAIFKLVEYATQFGERAVLKQYFAMSIFGFGSTFAQLLYSYLSLTSLLYTVFMFIVYRTLYMSYTMQKANRFTLFSVLVYLITDSFLLSGIFIFALRKKPRINYDAYFESRARWAQGQANPYGNRYGNNGNPYSTGSNGGQYQQRDINPFEEFDGAKGNSSSKKHNDDDDGFFN